MLEIKVKKYLPGFHLDIELTANREILSILGPSGSGKTMTLLCIAGLLCPDEGKIRLNGKTLFDSENGICLPPRKRNVGFVFQSYALFPHLTVAENIAYGLQGSRKQIITKRVNELLEIIHIPGLRDRYPGELSSGQQQRVALARALAPEPEALLLDEPFSALDTFRKERLEYELMNLQKFYSGDILFVTHDLNQGFKLGNQIAIFDNGKIAQCDKSQTVISSPLNKAAAKLTGIKNLFGGRVTVVRNESLEVYIPELSDTLTVLTGNAADYTGGQSVYLGIRPEHVEITDKPKNNTVPCRVEQVIDGITSLYLFYCADSEHGGKCKLESCTPRPFSPPRFAAGEPCLLYLSPERLILIPGEPL